MSAHDPDPPICVALPTVVVVPGSAHSGAFWLRLSSSCDPGVAVGVLLLSYRAKMSVAGVGAGWNDTSPKPNSASQDW
jgi:hypothetical protein